MKRLLITLIVLGFGVPWVAWAAMSSTHYTIYSDSVGLGGGLVTSTTYTVEESLANPTDAAYATSSSYVIHSGYQAATWNTIAVSVNPASINLGTLSAASVASATATVVVSTDAPSGYNLSIESVSGSMPASVAGGTVFAGTESYGVAVSGSHAAFADDEAVNPNTTLASCPTAIFSDTTTLTFKASMSAASTPGAYSQVVNIIASAHF